jgi:hypothetical protein
VLNTTQGGIQQTNVKAWISSYPKNFPILFFFFLYVLFPLSLLGPVFQLHSLLGHAIVSAGFGSGTERVMRVGPLESRVLRIGGGYCIYLMALWVEGLTDDGVFSLADSKYRKGDCLLSLRSLRTTGACVSTVRAPAGASISLPDDFWSCRDDSCSATRARTFLVCSNFPSVSWWRILKLDLH